MVADAAVFDVDQGRRKNCASWSFHTQPAIRAAQIHTSKRSSRSCCEEAVGADTSETITDHGEDGTADNSEVISDDGGDGTIVVDDGDPRMMFNANGTADIATAVAPAAIAISELWWIRQYTSNPKNVPKPAAATATV